MLRPLLSRLTVCAILHTVKPRQQAQLLARFGSGQVKPGTKVTAPHMALIFCTVGISIGTEYVRYSVLSIRRIPPPVPFLTKYCSLPRPSSYWI